MKIPTSKTFTLNGGDLAFTNRQQALFDQLAQAEKTLNKDQPVESNSDVIVESTEFSRPAPPGKRKRSETRQFRGKESIFKRPDLPSPFADKTTPDHRRNPHKWVKYSLDDVQNADMSDKSNTQAALSFLSSLKARNSSHQSANVSNMEIDVVDTTTGTSGCSSSTGSVIVFKKPVNKNRHTQQDSPVIVENNDKPVFRGSKIVLPEYVVGQKQVKTQKEKKDSVKVDRKKQLKLNHLEELDDEEC